MARKRARTGNGTALFFVLVLLAVGGCLAYLEWQRRQAASNPLEQTADMVSDGRLIYGGAPRARAGSGSEADFEVLKNDGYIVGYSERRHEPLWAAYRVFHPAIPNHNPRPPGFTTDVRTTARVRESDFAGSGYDRGHMAPNEAIMEEYGGEAQLQTFLLSNICPQAPNLNRKVWEQLERKERTYAPEMEELWVMDGPVFGDLNGAHTDYLGEGIAVPAAFFKIIVDEEGKPGGKPRLFAVIMPQGVNGTELPQQFLTTVAEIEKETHLEFLWKLDPATRADLENKKWGMW